MIESQTANILIVDDNLDNLNVLAGMLSEHNYKVRRAINGKIALKTITAIKPNLILLDINLPDLSGYEICTQLQQEPRTCDIPIIFISALNSSQDKVKAYSVGGVDYVSKPFDITEVLTRVTHQLQLQSYKLAVLELQAPLARLKINSHSLLKSCETLDSQYQAYIQAIQSDSQSMESAITELHQRW